MRKDNDVPSWLNSLFVLVFLVIGALGAYWGVRVLVEGVFWAISTVVLL